MLLMIIGTIALLFYLYVVCIGVYVMFIEEDKDHKRLQDKLNRSKEYGAKDKHK